MKRIEDAEEVDPAGEWEHRSPPIRDLIGDTDVNSKNGDPVGPDSNDTFVASLLGAHLEEVRARIDTWGRELLRTLSSGAKPVGVPYHPTVADAHSAVHEDPSTVHSASKHATQVIADFELQAGWYGWQHHQAVRLGPDGEFELRQSRSTPGITSPDISVEGHRLLRVHVDLFLVEAACPCRLFLRVVSKDGRTLGPEILLTSTITDQVYFVPASISKIAVLVLAGIPEAGAVFRIRRCEISYVDSELWLGYTRGVVQEPVYAGLASLPERRLMLADAVASLLVQCDKVRVFLNEYPDVPAFLNHPRIEVRRSQDWDNKGDAGKFAWIEEKNETGYRIVADDDLIYPPDFVARTVACLQKHGNRAFVGGLGILLRQPMERYYDPKSAWIRHFQSAQDRERTVHVLGTCTLPYHSTIMSLRWADFHYSNMADIYIAKYAQEKELPMLSLERPRNWIIQNTQTEKFSTIFDSSTAADKSRFDSSLIQSAVLQSIAPLTLQKSTRAKIVFCIFISDTSKADQLFKKWMVRADKNIDWVLIVCVDGDLEYHREIIHDLGMDYETHFVCESAGELAVSAVALIQRISSDTVCFAMHDLEIPAGEWLSKVCSQAVENNAVLSLVQDAGEGAPIEGGDASNTPNGRLPLLTVAPHALVCQAGDVDPGFVSMADGLAEWLTRLHLAALDGSSKAGTAAGDDAVDDLPGCSLRVSPIAETALTPSGKANLATKVGWRQIKHKAKLVSINGIFEKVFVINLDRRPDRWAKVCQRLKRAGVEAERVAAVDGQSDRLITEFQTYRSQPLIPLPAGVRKVKSSRDFYHDYDSQRARVHFEEFWRQRKAIASAGAWAYLATWENILEEALIRRWETVLILDDDVILHKNTQKLFAAAFSELPKDWLVFLLGSMQYHWDPLACSPRGRYLYSPNGSVIGSHAVGLDATVIPYLLDLIRRRELPVDIGAVSAVTLDYRDRCFVAKPNLLIQELADTDIGTGDFIQEKPIEKVAPVFRWHLDDYDFS